MKEVCETFEIIPARGEEQAAAKTPEALVKALAYQKADEVFSSLSDTDKIVLGADTVVAYRGQILGKPHSKKEAEEMLFALSGQTHEVLTGVCFLYTLPNGERGVELDCEKTQVVFERLEKKFIEDYVAGGSPMDKAGAYGIQDGGLVKEICGSYSNVVGLPVELCKKAFEKIIEKRRGS